MYIYIYVCVCVCVCLEPLGRSPQLLARCSVYNIYNIFVRLLLLINNIIIIPATSQHRLKQARVKSIIHLAATGACHSFVMPGVLLEDGWRHGVRLDGPSSLLHWAGRPDVGVLKSCWHRALHWARLTIKVLKAGAVP